MVLTTEDYLLYFDPHTTQARVDPSTTSKLHDTFHIRCPSHTNIKELDPSMALVGMKISWDTQILLFRHCMGVQKGMSNLIATSPFGFVLNESLKLYHSEKVFFSLLTWVIVVLKRIDCTEGKNNNGFKCTNILNLRASSAIPKQTSGSCVKVSSQRS